MSTTVKDILSNRMVMDNDAVMFDIDDTLIYTDGKANYFVIDLLHHARSLGYQIIIITARQATPDVMQYTKMQLQHYNIPYDGLAITPPLNKGNVKLKSGLNYVLSVGDQPTDLTHTMYAMKIPPREQTNLC